MSFAIYSQNLVDQSTISASTQNALFPSSNIQDPRRSKVFRSTTNSDSIVFDFNETSDVDTVFVVPDKRAGFGVSTITLEFNATNTWGAPAATESVDISITHGLAFKEFLTTHSYRFCRMVVTSTLGYCEVANVFLGKKDDISKSINFGWTYKDDDKSIKKFNRYGQQFTDIINRVKTISCEVSYMNKDDLDKFFLAYDYCGESKPLFIRLGCVEMSNDFRRFSGMVYFNETPTISNRFFNKYGASLSFREAT